MLQSLCYGSTKHALVTVALVVAVIGLFCTPLLLRYRVYIDHYLPVVSSDIIPVNGRISTIWCSSQRLEMNSTFSVHAFRGRPRVLRTLKRKEFRQRVVLRNEAIEYWGFYLLDGSVMTVNACSKLAGATIAIVKGHRHLMACLKQHNEELVELNDRSLESSMDDYRQSSSMSSSEGFFSNETSEDNPFQCTHKLKEVKLNSSFSCTLQVVRSGRTLTYDSQLAFRAPSNGYYYVVFASDSYLDIMPNEIFAHFSVDRRSYNLTGDHANCSEVTSCDVDLTFGAREFVVVEVVHNGSDLFTDTLVSKCIPRKGLYFVFFILMACLILVCAFQ